MDILIFEVSINMKKLHTGQYLWPIYNQLKALNTASLSSSLKTDVVVVGGGISGILTAYQLWRANIDFVVVEAHQIAHGSSLASSGLLQYCSDISLPDLRSTIGKNKADTFYQACYSAIDELQQLLEEVNLKGETQFERVSSLQYASCNQDTLKLQAHYAALSELGLPCELWGKKKIEEHYSFSKPLALVTHHDAVINPYALIRNLSAFLLHKGIKIIEHAKVTSQSFYKDDISLTINNEYEIIASHVIYAIGYQPEQLQEDKIKPILNRTYTVVTNPITQLAKRYDGKLIWETAKPYLYIRTTQDNRLIIGGLDERQQAPNEDPVSVEQHNKQLLNELIKLFPFIKDEVKIEYAWNATFAESYDQLPYIGASPKHKQILYLCGYGGNGTVYSMLGSKLLTDYIMGKDVDDNIVATAVALDRE